jgi:steroid delta-isomerase-like uncharacterized protein
MSTETEKLVRDFFAALDAGDLDRAYGLCTADFDYRPRGRATSLSIEDHRTSMHVLHAAFEDSEHRVVDQFSAGDRVATRFVFSGVMKGSYVGVPASNRRETCSGIAMDRIVDGKIAERHVEVDLYGILQRTGAKVVGG